MSETWENNKVWESLTLQAENKIKHHVTETINDYYCHVTPLLLFRKRPMFMLHVAVNADAADGFLI